jgi:transcription-repair coupling factor (superfamily II helicase)
MHPELLNAMRRQPAFARSAEQLPLPANTLHIGGLPGSSAALFLAGLSEYFPTRLWVVVTANPPDAEAVEADLIACLGEGRAALYPQRETLPYEAAEHHLEVSGLRVEALEALFSGRVRILVTTTRALQERTELPGGLAELRLTLSVGQTLRPQQLSEQLERMGFQRAPLVEAVGEYALRGGILDLFGFGAPDPIRLEFWGDDIVSIRPFDILNQRSTTELSQVDILPVDLTGAHHEQSTSVRRSLLDLLADSTILVDMAPVDAGQEFTRTWNQVVHLHDAERKRGGTAEAPVQLFLSRASRCGCTAQPFRPHPDSRHR